MFLAAYAAAEKYGKYECGNTAHYIETLRLFYCRIHISKSDTSQEDGLLAAGHAEVEAAVFFPFIKG